MKKFTVKKTVCSKKAVPWNY